ncbi:MAG TPA: Dyp-type peroxidase [Thermoleophilaceae bacterium]|jgi:Dyp-type peroxidase family
MPADPSPPVEPVLDAGQIQGNVVPGFMKPSMAVSALVIEDVGKAKSWIAATAPRITTLAQAMETREQVRALRTLRPLVAGTLGAIPDEVDDQWVNVGFSHQGLGKLLAGGSHEADLEQFEDEAFSAGLAARSSLLGDPTDPAAEGNPANWVVGGPGQDADVLLVFGADRPEALAEVLQEVRDDATANGMAVLYEEQGAKLDDVGSEHFGFQDGVSQPGVRGRYSDDPDSFVTQRTIDPSAVPDSWLYGLPGQLLVWPGEFVFGYPGAGADPLVAGAVNLPGPEWSRNGSYLSFRRLRQDVPGFWRFLTEQAGQLAGQPGFEGWTAERLGANLIGRWKSGAPVARVPDADVPELGVDRLANNNFGFAADSEALPLVGGGSDAFPEAEADPVGLTCPLAAHIRKVQPRETPNDLGGRRASQSRRLLRRGLPYGPQMTDPFGPDPADGDRGLLFVSYQASLREQFEFLCTTWMGSPLNPRSPSGFDMVVGENGQPGEGRVKQCVLFGTGAAQGAVSSDSDFVIPTGGGYFFSPSIGALTDVLAAQ